MSSKQKPYEMVGRPSIHSHGPQSSASKARVLKILAALLASAFALYTLHSILTPSDNIYGLMIDAGSTGSRIHTFTFQRHPHTSQLKVLSEDFHALKPGLSSFKDSPPDAAKSLQPLLDRARSRVPKHAHATTPVVLRATAGLRMLGDKASTAILTEVRKTLRASPFRFDSDDWASILAGNEEAVYSWMTVNYLLNKPPSATVGTLEMGGGSAQIAYVPRDGDMASASDGMNCSMPAEHLSFGGKKVDLYTVSHLDFGLQKARKLLFDKFRSDGKLMDNPCFNRGNPIKVDIPFDESGKTLTISGKGDYESCRKLIESSLISPALGPCSCQVCTYKGAAQPKAIPEYVAFAFYLERTVSVGIPSPMTVADVDAKASEICKMSVEDVGKEYAVVPNGEATDLCLDMAYISLHLERGHGIARDGDTKLVVADKIDDFELGWCLGAMQETMSKLFS